MFYYALGSILFAFALTAAFAVMTLAFAHYWQAMKAALRSLSMDGFDPRPAKPAISLPTTRPTLSRLPRAA